MELDDQLKKLQGKTVTVSLGDKLVEQQAMLELILQNQAQILAHFKGGEWKELYNEMTEKLSKMIIDIKIEHISDDQPPS